MTTFSCIHTNPFFVVAFVAFVASLIFSGLEGCSIVAFMWHFVATYWAVQRKLWHCGILFI
nr:MAG TPA: hypothetical protein [Caudoviricetes sp.]